MRRTIPESSTFIADTNRVLQERVNCSGVFRLECQVQWEVAQQSGLADGFGGRQSLSIQRQSWSYYLWQVILSCMWYALFPCASSLCIFPHIFEYAMRAIPKLRLRNLCDIEMCMFTLYTCVRAVAKLFRCGVTFLRVMSDLITREVDWDGCCWKTQTAYQYTIFTMSDDRNLPTSYHTI